MRVSTVEITPMEQRREPRSTRTNSICPHAAVHASALLQCFEMNQNVHTQHSFLTCRLLEMPLKCLPFHSKAIDHLIDTSHLGHCRVIILMRLRVSHHCYVHTTNAAVLIMMYFISCLNAVEAVAKAQKIPNRLLFPFSPSIKGVISAWSVNNMQV